METLKFNLNKKGGKFKILNATNGGPWHNRHSNDQFRSNFDDYKAARIPYSRNHDAAFSPTYGGPFAHDIAMIFRDFNADPYLPESYDFECTDEAILTCLDAGTKTYFRLGHCIEHQIKKHGTLPPPDFKKWAIICEQVIRHYTEGWANGYHLDIEYWEIWNEPDLDTDDSTNKRTWGGTKAQFFDLYEIAAKHLKACFPHLKIGGPALAHDVSWGEDFLREMSNRNVPIDFFSWHIYTNDPIDIKKRAEKIENLLIKYGYENTENHLNEWNYIRDWVENFVYSIKAIHGAKGAAFLMAGISISQSSPIDMLMYYDTRPGVFNAAFDLYTYECLKGYYPLYWYGKFYDLDAEVRAENEIEDIYSLCGIDKDGKILSAITYYTDNDNAENAQIKIDFGRKGNFEIFLVDEENTNTPLGITEDLSFDLKPNSIVFIKEV